MTHIGIPMPIPGFRWPGNKRKRARDLLSRLGGGEPIVRLIEPFAGSLACTLYALGGDSPPECIAYADANNHLLRYWQTLTWDPDAVVQRALSWVADATARGQTMIELYREARALTGEGRSKCRVTDAAVFLLLNRMSFCGIWRVNKGGQHNVQHDPQISSPEQLDRKMRHAEKWAREAARRLQRATHTVTGSTWRDVVSSGPNDVLIIDPPYTGTWTGYTQQGWSESDDEDLCRWAERESGQSRWVITLDDNERTRELYGALSSQMETITVQRQTLGQAGYQKKKELHIWSKGLVRKA